MDTDNTIYFIKRNNPDLFIYFYPSKNRRMKKLSVLIFLLLSSATIFGQINPEDSTVQVIAYWDKGETHNYKVINKKTQLKNEEIISSDSVVYNVELSVLDSTANSYSIQWLYKDNVNKDLKVIYKTNELGEFEEVLNWEEIRDFVNRTTNSILQGLKKGETSDESLDKLEKEITSTFSTKEAIESVGVNEIVQYHMFHGVTYKLGDYMEGEIEVPNVLGSKPFTANTYFGLEEIMSDEEYLLKSVQSIDKEQLTVATLEYLKKLSESVGKSFDTEAVQNMQFENETTTHSALHDSGWVIYSIMQKVVTNGDITVINECSIEME